MPFTFRYDLFFCSHHFYVCAILVYHIVLGASDDAVSCAVMLDILHSLANQSSRLHHGVIFLFNGAEENVLQVK